MTNKSGTVEESLENQKLKIGDLVEFSGCYIAWGDGFTEEIMSINPIQGLVIEIKDSKTIVKTEETFCSFPISSNQTIWRIVSRTYE